MAEIYVLASIPGQGKTTVALVLEKYFKSQGLKVACLQCMKGQWDVGIYLKNNCNHYSMPLEATKDMSAFEKWLPQGYDVYILEVGFAHHSPTGIAYIDLFQNINEVSSYETKDTKEFLEKYGRPIFYNDFYDRNVQKIITKVPTDIDLETPWVDSTYTLLGVDKLHHNNLKPKMTLSKSDKEVIAVGAFPGEFKDIFPNIIWYGYDYPSFVKGYKKEDYDIAIIGACTNDKIKFTYKPKKLVFCYHPPVYMSDLKHYHDIYGDIKSDLREVYRRIKVEPVGTQLAVEECLYSVYNNKFWVFQEYLGLDCFFSFINNIIICNGWVLPQYLIKEGYLEV